MEKMLCLVLKFKNNMIKKKIFQMSLIFIFFASDLYAQDITNHKIAVLVNDQLISTFDIIQRVKMNAILTGTNITPDNNDQIKNSAINELIQEKLKDEKIVEYEISISNEEFLKQENNFFNNSEFNKEDMINIFQLNNINYDDFKRYLISQLSWQKLISGMYFRMTSASKIEIDEILDNNPDITEDIAREIIIQRQLDLKSGKMIRDMLDEATIEYK